MTADAQAGLTPFERWYRGDDALTGEEALWHEYDATLTRLRDSEITAEAESAAMEYEGDGPALTALYDALRYASDALGAALGLVTGCPSSSLLEASTAASEAFGLGTPQSEALGRILTVISDRAAGVSA